MTPLVPIDFPSIYRRHGERVLLPQPLAQCAPDTKSCLFRAAEAVRSAGGALILSDLFRSYDMQLGSHTDYVSGKKSAFSPPPGGSLHEAGRAFDLDLDTLGMKLKDFWDIAEGSHLTPIISAPDRGKSEAWHFECRGSHALVYDYYKAGKGNNFKSPYQAMAASAIVSVGVRHDAYPERGREAYVQSALIRLGQQIGNLDGLIGRRTRDGLAALGIAETEPDGMLSALEDLLQERFPQEFFEHVTAAPPPSAPAGTSFLDAPLVHDGSGNRDAILAAARSSPIAAYQWHDRGRAPAGYIKGMALAFAHALDGLGKGDSVIAAIAAPPSGDPAKDVLDWFAAELADAGARVAGGPEDRLAAVFTILLGLGMRESSGQHCEGRDMSADNTSPQTAEAGLFQVSFNSADASPLLTPLIGAFAGRRDLLEVFGEGVRCKADYWKAGPAEGETFQALTKTCPLFAVYYAALLLRVRRKHWGPVIRRKVEILPASLALFTKVRQLQT